MLYCDRETMDISRCTSNHEFYMVTLVIVLCLLHAFIIVNVLYTLFLSHIVKLTVSVETGLFRLSNCFVRILSLVLYKY